MRSLRALRVIGIGLAFAAILAGGGLLVGSQTGQEGQPSLIVTLSYPDSMVACIEALFAADGRLIKHTVKTTPVGQGPSWLDISPDGTVTYVVNWDAKSLTVIDNAKCVGVRALTFGGNLYAGAFRPDGAAFYAIDAENKRIIVLDTKDLTNPQMLTQISLPGSRSPRGLAFHPDGQWAYVSDTETDTVWVLDAVNHRLQETLHTGGQCSAYVKASNSGQWVYVSDRCLSRVYAYETATKTFTAIQLSGNSGAWFSTFEPNDLVAFVSQTDPRRNISSGKISIIDVAQKKEIGTIDVSRGATAVTLASLAGEVLSSGPTEFVPADLEVLSLGDARGVLTVFPFLAETPMLGVPITLRTDPTGAISVEAAPPFRWPPLPGLSRPFTGTFFASCDCESASITAKEKKDGTQYNYDPNKEILTITITITTKRIISCKYKNVQGSCNITI